MIGLVLRFGLAGAIGFGVDAGTLLVAAPLLGPVWGRLVSFAAAVLTTWAINRNLAFADRPRTTGKGLELLRYFGAMLPGAAVNWLAYGIVLALLAETTMVLVLAVAAGSLAGMATNLVAADRLVFRRREL
ncbi:GtrA family protein [Devosia chinhatensis]|uniref:GtrA/DPMS transmembrane domain-containing protein n=1 Tax=Devosia chinhatensis TaxID=429727 RepID=A0A0F5FJG7_9HYPH|nr:GtrA family protein [Devosia chinhatensis]KKB08705.1 hypothetical protein VE26_01055 [Devosia chinhatensis]